jgi:hypothetical protein
MTQHRLAVVPTLLPACERMPQATLAFDVAFSVDVAFSADNAENTTSTENTTG